MQKSLALAFTSCFVFAACQRTPEPSSSGAATTSNAGSTPAPSVSTQGVAPALSASGERGSSAGMPANGPMGGMGKPGMTPGTGGPKTMVYTAPKTWTSSPNPNTFRKATFKVPGPAGDAELAVSESGGSLADNITRWEKQFGEAKAKTATREVGGLKVTTVELRGTYSNGMAMGNVKPQPNSVLLGAIVETDTPHFFKLTGPEKTVDAAKKDWEEFIKTFRPGS